MCAYITRRTSKLLLLNAAIAVSICHLTRLNWSNWTVLVQSEVFDQREELKDKETLSSRISEACQKVEHNDLHGYVEHSADRIADCLNKCAMYFFILSYIYPLTSIISLCISINFSSMVTDELTIGRDIEKRTCNLGNWAVRIKKEAIASLSKNGSIYLGKTVFSKTTFLVKIRKFVKNTHQMKRNTSRYS